MSTPEKAVRRTARRARTANLPPTRAFIARTRSPVGGAGAAASRMRNRCRTAGLAAAASSVFTGTMAPTAPVPPRVADSWARSAAAGVLADDADIPITLSPDAVLDCREAHSLARVLPLLDDIVGTTARDSGAVMAISDASGQLLWVCGTPALVRRAKAVGFTEGANWNERCAGTNAPGLALALDEPVIVTGEQHFRQSMRRWSCAASPIHDPMTHHVLGALDLTSDTHKVSPAVAGLVRATARLAETELARQNVALTAGSPTPSSRLSVSVEALGRSVATMQVTDGAGKTACLQLSPRHSELVHLLASSEYGLTGDEIAVLIYVEDCGRSTLRAELNRLRHLLGEDLLASRPYRLQAQVRSDWRSLEAYLATGEVAAALRLYRGPLLPGSEAPGVVRTREVLHGSLRRAVLTSHRCDLMASWTRAPWGQDDYQMWQALLGSLHPGSPLLPTAAAQVARLDRLLGVPSRRQPAEAPVRRRPWSS